MDTDSILKGIDQHIAQLRQVRAALLGLGNIAGRGNAMSPAGKRRGRPKGTVNKMEAARPALKKIVRRAMSAEGKAKIAAAQKKRWAAQKNAQEPVESPV